MPEIFTATGDSVCCLQRIGNKSFAPFSHFPITYLFTNCKVKNAQNTVYDRTCARRLVVGSFFLGKFPLNIGTSVGFVF